MNSIDIETLLTILFVEIDDWYQEKGHQWMAGRAGRKPKFSASLSALAEYVELIGQLTNSLDPKSSAPTLN